MAIGLRLQAQHSYATDMAKTVMTIWKDSLSINGKPASGPTTRECF